MVSTVDSLFWRFVDGDVEEDVDFVRFMIGWKKSEVGKFLPSKIDPNKTTNRAVLDANSLWIHVHVRHKTSHLDVLDRGHYNFVYYLYTDISHFFFAGSPLPATNTSLFHPVADSNPSRNPNSAINAK